ncbi:thiamine-phosphate kinase [Polyangium mundeleinium]|uniref:Thiamine-monophosphate kinase n=1 Tax=Polyangium mundeleinium TaxID=2995306 RepID=A0ABT5EI83_9BACT|nr:thiamine-phosphate kinase [Polyangium mundeleinium]MDC0741204.1 thiamine-phosphate kinase [Polyangium mundeleinium]
MTARSSERARIDMLSRVFGANGSSRTIVGIGDDAAVIAPGQEPLVWTVDAQVEGIHFRRDLVSMADLGYRATMAAASDLAAMGASPLGILAGLVLPADVTDEDLCAIAEGQREAAEEVGTQIIGGNLARGQEISITTTVLGETPRPLGRSGAKPGEVLAIAGPLGLSAAGLVLIGRGREREADAAPAVRAYRRPIARIAAGLAARDVASAAIDVSDGLTRDVGHVARASGVLVVLDRSTLLTPELERAAALAEADPYQLALEGGEDYAVVVTVPEDRVPAGFKRIGRVVPAQGGKIGIAVEHTDGTLTPLDERGYDHFG